MSRDKNKKNKPKITITELLSVESTAPARMLLKKYGKEDPKNYADLQYKLSELYRDAEDKKALEKEIALIHPHKDFILKNLAPTPAVVVDEKKDKEVKITPTENANQMKVIHDGYSSCEGDSKCNCHKRFSNACGCQSGFDGTGPNQQVHRLDNGVNKDLLVFGVIVITALIIYKHKS